MSWETVATGVFASHPAEVEGPARVVAGLKEIVAFMKEAEAERTIIVTNVAGGSAVSTIIRRAKAIVSTIGGPNSHIVIVARDYQVPCIVGATGLQLSTLAAGSRLRLLTDGSVQLCRATAAPGVSPDQLLVLRNVVFAGAARTPEEIIGAGPRVGEALAALSAAGFIETDGIIAPTDAGIAALEGWYESARSRLDEARRNRLHDEFRPLDVSLKKVTTAWQEADARDDWDARMSVLEELQKLHREALAYIARHATVVPRLDEYNRRLSAALDKVLNGDTVYVAGVDTDSYHTIWFQMHEDLLRLLQRQRDPELA